MAAPKILLVDPEFSDVMADALARMNGPKPLVVDVDDAAFSGGQRIGQIEYEAMLASGDPNYAWSLPRDEWDAIALGYTSGTTGNPKGVVTHHRGAYLNAVSNILSGRSRPASGVSLDAADVPLQRLVLPMDDCGRVRR